MRSLNLGIWTSSSDLLCNLADAPDELGMARVITDYSSIEVEILKEINKLKRTVGIRNGGLFRKEEVVAFYLYHSEFERFTQYKSNWKLTTFKKVCAGLEYRINPDREGNRWLKSVNVENRTRTSIKWFPKRERSKAS